MSCPHGNWNPEDCELCRKDAQLCLKDAEISALKAQLYAWTSVFGHLGTADECGNEWIALKDRLDYTERGLAEWRAVALAHQAREQQLRTALSMADAAWGQPEYPAKIVVEALALPHDDTALKARLAAERERCAKVVDALTAAGQDSLFGRAIRDLGDA